MAFCTQCGQPLIPGMKFCTKCGKKVPDAVVTPPAAPQTMTPPVAPQAMTPPVVPQVAMQAPPPIVPQAVQVTPASNPLARVFDIRANNQPGSWTASSLDRSAFVTATPTSLLTRIKNFFIPANKLAYLWGLLPVLTTLFTILSYIFHLIGKLFS